MRVAFICADSTPRRDGVGDYTRLLAQTLAGHGAQTQVLALNVRHDPAGAFGVLALPETMEWRERLRRAKRALSEFRADAISLQYVPHGWNPKGLPLRKARDLSALCRRWPSLLTLHELWQGSVPPSEARDVVYGTLQRPISLALARSFGPGGTATTNAAYRDVLARHGIEAALLPLMGNLVPRPADRDAVRRTLLARLAPEAAPDETWLCGLFGSRPAWLARPETWRTLQDALRRAGRVPVLALLGGPPPGDAELAGWRASLPGVPIGHPGELDDAALSAHLQALDLAVTPTRPALIGKSGSAAAVMEHGVPVVSLFPPGRHASVGPAGQAVPLFLGDAAHAADRLASGDLPRGRVGWTGDAVAHAFMALLQTRIATG
jgi:hypothetical protein